MKRRHLSRVALLSAATVFLVTAIALTAEMLSPEKEQLTERTFAGKVQCGQASVLRLCDLLGVPLDLSTVMRELPCSPRGHSMLEIRALLAKLGISADGRSETFDAFRDGSFPCIAHLNAPEPHFVVVVAVSGDRVLFFDGAGRRTSLPTGKFCDRWSGNALWAKRTASIRETDQSALSPSPEIRFETFLIDAGQSVREDDAPLAWEFLLRNEGTAPLEIGAIKTSCPCIVAEAIPSVVEPGGSGVLIASYRDQSSKGNRYKAGPFVHNIAVQTNDPRNRTVTLKVAGDTSPTVHVAPSKVVFGRALAGTVTTRHVFVNYSESVSELKITSATSDIAGVDVKVLQRRPVDVIEGLSIVSRTYPHQIPIEVALSPADDVCGILHGNIVLVTNAPGHERIVIPVKAEVSPLIQIIPAFVKLECAADVPSEVVGRFTVRARDDSPLTFVECEPMARGVHCRLSGKADASDLHFEIVSKPDASESLSESGISLRLRVGDRDRTLTVAVPVFRDE